MPILDHGGARRSDLSILDSVGPSTYESTTSENLSSFGTPFQENPKRRQRYCSCRF